MSGKGVCICIYDYCNLVNFVVWRRAECEMPDRFHLCARLPFYYAAQAVAFIVSI